ncbi:MAG: amidase [Acidobacteria bacterium]|nr:amidase [Acidobacteriota bacterium]
MSAKPPHFRSITELAPLLAARAITSEALTESCLAEIAGKSEPLHAFITVTGDEALDQARALDRELSAGRCRGPLHGIPISLKDLIDVGGVPTTAASQVRQGHVASKDAPVTARLREAGAVFVGKTNLHEFAFGTTSEDSAYGAVRNPHDPARSPGGSSGGSAVSIVTGMSVASIGTDTGGSIRIPSAACGTVGLKPTWGEVPCDGVVPLSESLDHVGPLARCVADAWLLYLILRGDRSAALWPLPARSDVRGLRLGVPRPYFLDLVDDQVRQRFAESLAWLRQAGAETVDVVIPHAAEIGTIYLHTSLPEASAYHARAIEEHPELYTPNVRLRIEMGRYLLAEDYVRAQRGRRVLRAEVDTALAGCDALAMPTLPITAPLIGANSVDIAGKPEPVRNMMLRATQLFNLTGHPAISLPMAQTAAGLPCGMQLVGRRHATEALLGLASACEAHMAF